MITFSIAFIMIEMEDIKFTGSLLLLQRSI